MTYSGEPRPPQEVLGEVYRKAKRYRARRAGLAAGSLMLIVVLAAIASSARDGEDTRRVTTLPAGDVFDPEYEPRMLVPRFLPDGFRLESWTENPTIPAPDPTLLKIFTTAQDNEAFGEAPSAFVRFLPMASFAPPGPGEPFVTVRGQLSRSRVEPDGRQTIVIVLNQGAAEVVGFRTAEPELIALAESVNYSPDSGRYSVDYRPSGMREVQLAAPSRPAGLFRTLSLAAHSGARLQVTTFESGARSLAQLDTWAPNSSTVEVRGHSALSSSFGTSTRLVWIDENGVHVQVEGANVSNDDATEFARSLDLLRGDAVDDYLASLGPPEYRAFSSAPGPQPPQQLSRPVRFGVTRVAATTTFTWANKSQVGGVESACFGVRDCEPLDATVAGFTWRNSIGSSATTWRAVVPLDVSTVELRYQRGGSLSLRPVRPFPDMKTKWLAAADTPNDLIESVRVHWRDGRVEDVPPPPPNILRLLPQTTVPPLTDDERAKLDDFRERVKVEVIAGRIHEAYALAREFNRTEMRIFTRSPEASKLHGHLSGATMIDVNPLEARRNNLREIARMLDIPQLDVERMIPE